MKSRDDGGAGAPVQFNGVKTFTATMAHDREALGDRITRWLRESPDRRVVDTVVTQSSDESFHCLAITIFFWQPTGAARPVG
jgi:hypothetical protein